MNEEINVVQVPTGLYAPAALKQAQDRLLSRFSDGPRADNLQAAIDDKNSILIVAIAGPKPLSDDDWQAVPSEAYAGTLTLVLLQTPWHILAHVEEVIVDSAHEGKGVGKKLMMKAIEVGRENGVKQFDLTSSPNKVAAQALYEKVGFKKRDTNNWRLEN